MPHSQAEEERLHIRLLNQLPTYENMIATYECLLQNVRQTSNTESKVDDRGIRIEEQGPNQISHISGMQYDDPISGIEKHLIHRKERMFFMIINLLRLRPQIFMEQIGAFKARCDLRQTAVRGLLVFAPEDVDSAVEMLSSVQGTHLLELNSDLVECCRDGALNVKMPLVE